MIFVQGTCVAECNTIYAFLVGMSKTLSDHNHAACMRPKVNLDLYKDRLKLYSKSPKMEFAIPGRLVCCNF